MTDDAYQIEFMDEPEWGVIGSNLKAFNVQQTGNDRHELICYVLRAPDQEIVGGVIGKTYWGWLYIELLWVHADLRGCGYGQRLLSLVEEKGRKNGATHAYLDTFSFQAPDFYKNRGYHVFGELPDFPPGHQRYFMSKQL